MSMTICVATKRVGSLRTKNVLLLFTVVTDVLYVAWSHAHQCRLLRCFDPVHHTGSWTEGKAGMRTVQIY